MNSTENEYLLLVYLKGKVDAGAKHMLCGEREWGSRKLLLWIHGSSNGETSTKHLLERFCSTIEYMFHFNIAEVYMVSNENIS